MHAAIAVRQIPLPVHQALKLRAVQNNRSMEAEVRQILIDTVAPPLRFGEQLMQINRDLAGAGADLVIERDRSPMKPAIFD